MNGRRGERGWWWALMVLMVVSPLGCGARLERFEFTRLEMGVRARVVTYAPSREEAERGAGAAFATLSGLDACMSDYRPDSELMRLCGAEAGKPVAVSEALFEVLRAGQGVSEASGGAFDVTVGPEVALWRRARKEQRLPGAEEIERARGLVGWRMVKLDASARTVTLARAGMRLDLGGIAKGYAVQRGVERLRGLGLGRSMVALAGDIAVGDEPPGERGWRIEVGGEKGRVLELRNAAVSTSGDSEQFVELGGVRYSHIVDPRTGWAMTTSVGATVVAARGEEADALSTAMTIVGKDAAVELARREGVSAVIRTAGEGATEVDGAGLLRWARE